MKGGKDRGIISGGRSTVRENGKNGKKQKQENSFFGRKYSNVKIRRKKKARKSRLDF